MLQKAGIHVSKGIEQEQHRELNRFFIKNIIHRMPYITVKIAQTIDAKISQARGKQSRITCDESVKRVHRWRSRYDAVLVGANTVRADHPQLNVRALKGRNPKRIILSARLELPRDEFYRGNTTLIFTGEKSETKFRDPSSSIVRIKELRNGNLSITDNLT
jgi:diaminohydroxyphosphoribosylaminopyrimidine deaminase/5-amino-6-(5-phosphoribosylamino)uracil reductase